VIEVVTKDVRTADIFNIMEGTGLAELGEPRCCALLYADGQYAVAICVCVLFAAIQGGDEEVPAEEAASWWKDAVTDEFSRQDVLVLALIAFCVWRLLIFMVQVTWRLARLPMRWYSALKKEEDREVKAQERNDNSDGEASALVKKQLESIRFCHLQFLLVVEKLKREMREEKNEGTRQMVVTLEVSQRKEGTEATLSEILATLQKIQEKDSSFRKSEVVEHLADIKKNVADQEDSDDDLPEAWAQLQDVYASFLRIQSTIVRREGRRKMWQWQTQQHNLQYQEEGEEGPRRRKRRLPSSSSEDEVLEELQELTKELPQGFTSDMFTSLGNAMHEKMVTTEPEMSPGPSPHMEIRPPRPSTAHTPVV
jgi:hypothetical protein